MELTKEHFDEIINGLLSSPELRRIQKSVEVTNQLMTNLSDDFGQITSRLMSIEEVLDDQTIENGALLRQSLKTTLGIDDSKPKHGHIQS